MRRWFVSAGAAAVTGVLVLAFVAGGGARPSYRPGGMFIGTGGPILPFSLATLSAVSAASRDAAWIVGSVAWRWDGKTWQAVELPKLGDGVLQAVSTVGKNDAWAVGYRGDGYLLHGRALVEHWDGTRWTVAQLPRLGPSILFAVSSAGTRSVWTVGATFGPGWTHPLLLRWDGNAWHRQPLPWSRRHVELDEVVATGPSSVWAVASGMQRAGGKIAGSILVEHWDGSRWQAVPAPFGPDDVIAGFGATSATDAWAVGSYAEGGSSIAHHSHALAALWDGHAWRIEAVPNRSGATDSALNGVVALRPDDVWALGESQHLEITKDGSGTTISSTQPVALFEHWNGHAWRLLPAARIPLWAGEPALTVAPDGAAWAIGSCRYDNVVARWSGQAWKIAAHPADRRRSASFPSARYVRCA